MKFKGICENTLSELKKNNQINNNNFHEYEPYYYTNANNTIYLDKEWFNSNPKFIQIDILNYLNIKSIKYELIKMELPHKYSWNEIEINIYWIFMYGHDYDKWYHYNIDDSPNNVKIIKLTQYQKNILSKITLRRCLSGSKLTENDIEEMDSIKSLLKEHVIEKQNYFVKLGSTSGKNERILSPQNNYKDILDFLTNCKQFLREEYDVAKNTHIILMPWNNNIKSKYEFRVFVHNKKITGISQQKWFICYLYTSEELEKIKISIFKSKFWDKLPYNSIVADVYYDINDNKCHFIECGPFGIFGPSGSSLFDWKKDYDILYGSSESEFRYIVNNKIIN